MSGATRWQSYVDLVRRARAIQETLAMETRPKTKRPVKVVG